MANKCLESCKLKLKSNWSPEVWHLVCFALRLTHAFSGCFHTKVEESKQMRIEGSICCAGLFRCTVDPTTCGVVRFPNCAFGWIRRVESTVQIQPFRHRMYALWNITFKYWLSTTPPTIVVFLGIIPKRTVSLHGGSLKKKNSDGGASLRICNFPSAA